MKKLKFLFLTLSIILASCNSDDDSTPPSDSIEFSITELSINKGLVGSKIIISGTGFPNSIEDINVTFGTIKATISNINSTSITTVIPDNAETGDIIVVYGSESINAGLFTVLAPLVQGKIKNLKAPQNGGQGQAVSGSFTKFDFATGTVTTSNTNWDIAFRGTTIALNGGTPTGITDEPTRNGHAAVSIVTGTFANITTAEGLSFSQDSDTSFGVPTGNNNGWYNYSGPPSHVITPIPGKVLVFRTRGGHYAKIEILSWYKDAPTPPSAFEHEGNFYTFNYVYNPNRGNKSFE